MQQVFGSHLAFDFSTRAGGKALKEASAPITPKWDGTVEEFPTFIVNLKLQATTCKWNATGSTRIIEIGGHDILLQHHSVTMAQVETERTNRTNDRAIQNSRAFYRCIESAEVRIQHTITVYAKIQQPPAWAQWVCDKENEFDNDAIATCTHARTECAYVHPYILCL